MDRSAHALTTFADNAAPANSSSGILIGFAQRLHSAQLCIIHNQFWSALHSIWIYVREEHSLEGKKILRVILISVCSWDPVWWPWFGSELYLSENWKSEGLFTPRVHSFSLSHFWFVLFFSTNSRRDENVFVDTGYLHKLYKFVFLMASALISWYYCTPEALSCQVMMLGCER